MQHTAGAGGSANDYSLPAEPGHVTDTSVSVSACDVGTSCASTWCLDLGCSVKLLQAVTQQIVAQITVVQCEYLSRPEGLSRSCCVHMHHSSNVISDAPVLMCFHASYRYGTDGWEVVFGYDQEKMMGERAGAALVLDLMDVDKKQSTPAIMPNACVVCDSSAVQI